MIRWLKIHNVRGIREAALLELAPLTVLTGPNASGKSTVLDALLIGASHEPADAVSRAITRHPGALAGAEWLFHRGASRASAHVGLAPKRRESSGNSWERTIALDPVSHSGDPRTTIRIHQTGTEANGLVQLTSENRVSEIASDPARRANREADQAYPPRSFDGLPTFLVDPGLPSPAPALRREFTRIGKSGFREAVHELLSELLPGFSRLEIGAFTDDEFGLMVAYEDGHWVPLALSGDGILALTEIAMRIAVPEGSLVLLEEPEVYLHPKAIWQLARALLANMRRGVQMVLTTHSLELIDALLGEAQGDDLENMALFNLRLEDGVLHSGRRAGEEIAFARETLENDLR